MIKTILITGGTDGIGKLAARKLVRDGHQVYIHGRNEAKLRAVVAELRTASDTAQVDGFVADFSDLDAVRAMAERVREQLPRLDVLINNAGVYKTNSATTEDGLDARFVVNFLAPYLLTQELLPLLEAGRRPRVINLSSAAQAPVSLPALAGETRLDTQAAYAQSKLALTAWSRYLAETTPKVTVIAVNPGSLLNTRMVREGFGFHQAPADKGADILYDLATAEIHDDASGRYFDNDIGRFGKAHPAVHDVESTLALIEQTDDMIDALLT